MRLSRRKHIATRVSPTLAHAKLAYDMHHARRSLVLHFRRTQIHHRSDGATLGREALQVGDELAQQSFLAKDFRSVLALDYSGHEETAGARRSVVVGIVAALLLVRQNKA